jgi:hypothetical protein
MKRIIAGSIGVVASMIFAFLLFAIAFNTPYSGLRLAFSPVYIAMFLCTFALSVFAPKHTVTVLLTVLLLPVLFIFYVASQNYSYYVDAVFLIVLCSIGGFLVSLARHRSSPCDKKPEGESGPRD